MRKKWLSLLLALAMLPGLLIPTASADTVNLSDKTVTLSVTPSQSTICVGSTGDVYVTYTISIASDDGATPIPAFSFVVPTDGKLATTATDSVWRFQLNTKLKQSQGGPYNTADYTPATGYVGVGGSDDNGITEKTTVMTIVAKFPADSAAGTYTPAFEEKDFIAGGTKDDGSVSANTFGKRNVVVDSVTVKPGAAVSGTVRDDKGTAVSDAAVELYKDGKAVVTGVTTDSSGTYTFSDVSTGTYTVKAKATVGGQELNGSAKVEVTSGNVSQDIQVQEGIKGDVNGDGEVDEMDRMYLSRYLAEWEGYETLPSTITADINGDGEVDEMDRMYLSRYLAEWEGYEVLGKST